jgi:hypothetical protein
MGEWMDETLRRGLAIEHQAAARRAEDDARRRHLEMMASHYAALAARARPDEVPETTN